MTRVHTRGLVYVGLLSALTTGVAQAADPTSPEEELQQLRREIEAQRKLLETQQKRIEQLELRTFRARGTQAAQQSTPEATTPAGSAPAAGTPADPVPSSVGQAPDTSRPPAVPALVDIRGVLTPRNKLIVEPSLQYS